MDFEEGVENLFEASTENVESLQEETQNLEQREQLLEQALSALEQDAALQNALESNEQSVEEEKIQLENKRQDALSGLEAIRQELEQLEIVNDKSDASLEVLRQLGEDTTEGDSILETRRCWLEECYRRVEELAAALGEEYEAIGKFVSTEKHLSHLIEEDAEEAEKTDDLQKASDKESTADPDPGSADAIQNYKQYMCTNNWSQADFAEYSQDPIWRELVHAAYPDYPLPPLNQKIAAQALRDYMYEHNWTNTDAAVYFRDPEWRRLMQAAYPERALPPLDQVTAKRALKEYMYAHGYGKEDIQRCAEDLEWRRLMHTAYPEYSLPELTQSAARRAIRDYMYANNFSKEDAAFYSKDPEWQYASFRAYPEFSTGVKAWAKEINPHYEDPNLPPGKRRAYSENCGSCALVMEQHFAGNHLDRTASSENIPYDADMEKVTGKRCIYMEPNQIEQILREEGPGSHLIVGIDRYNPITGAASTGHWFNAYFDGKTVHTVDGQSGELYEWPHDYGNVSRWCALI